jgi:transcriptional regulator with XRE-family HTH domain
LTRHLLVVQNNLHMTQADSFTPLRRIRLERHLSLEAVADGIGMNNGTISRIERGDTKASPETAEKLVKFFGEGISELEILYPERFMQPDHGGASAQP